MKCEIIDWAFNCAAAKVIRHEVFVQEQKVDPEEEWDEQDAIATHFLVSDAEGTPVATGRLQANGKVGRMAVLKAFRGQGVGQLLLATIVTHAEQQGFMRLYLNAQAYAEGFYRKLGFVAEGEPFMEAGIEHIMMVRESE